MPKKDSPRNNSHKIRIITNVLTTALKLWLKSQVSQVSQLEVEIKASDRQILSGRIPWVSIIASHAVYQGLNITGIQLVAENIQVNIGSILKGQQLKLLETVPVVGNLIVEEKDLNSSLSSNLLSSALNDVLWKILPEFSLKSQQISWQKIILANHQIILNAILSPTSEPTPLEMYVNLDLISGHELNLEKIQVIQKEVPIFQDEQIYHLDLGSDVDIQELSLTPGKLVCQGRINVNP
ncbi:MULTISPECIES: DUF2993 domain-containing protein [Cyanophyceae]|uniref:DUF2993 domain-containing protein n=1 Tax=Nodularia spumigena CENA596 TaxID=1819295 RepID=A0A166K0L1_NODSP|nr:MULTISPECIES: DUF2993 domain-containing protein [Cyanophyceae]KZL50408.1 hypothetical protein A2T98_07725 [Nodularia spumigena CENA596]MDB9302956.1 DUF2993 domain-containing protein [Nodularia spumigena CS-591/12]MDB9317312.1 DUF2993 domain-containing protein [Nodularia spumigena CS-590/01A]MDB9322634.1 DUF2993 domain-containing protein [Nodularia spumigena CS-591/07A]MDB9325752.1 DUF2993 domain-containing protein [Nodularia spumigena CS-590/02]